MPCIPSIGVASGCGALAAVRVGVHGSRSVRVRGLSRQRTGPGRCSHAAAFGGASFAGLRALQAVIHRVLRALVAAGFADLCANGTDGARVFVAACHRRSREPANVRTFDIERDASGHRFDVGLLQAGCSAVLAGGGALVARVDAVSKLLMRHVDLLAQWWCRSVRQCPTGKKRSSTQSEFKARDHSLPSAFAVHGVCRDVSYANAGRSFSADCCGNCSSTVFADLPPSFRGRSASRSRSSAAAAATLFAAPCYGSTERVQQCWKRRTPHHPATALPGSQSPSRLHFACRRGELPAA
jgi:hypothetical protein